VLSYAAMVALTGLFGDPSADGERWSWSARGRADGRTIRVELTGRGDTVCIFQPTLTSVHAVTVINLRQQDGMEELRSALRRLAAEARGPGLPPAA
jgi:hypothetical protein